MKPSLSPAMKQPKEVFQLILHELFPPLSLPIQLPVSWDRHVIRYPAHRILSIITLCRSWYLGGLPILFRDIQIQDFDHLSQLVQVLEKSTSSRLWVQSIELCFEYPQDEESFDIEFDKPFRQLSQMCPNLRTLASTPPTFRPSYSSIKRGRFDDAVYRAMFPFKFRRPLISPPCVLKNLYINNIRCTHGPGFIDALVHASKTLISLTIRDVDSSGTISNIATRLTCFSNLRTLTIPLNEVLLWMMQNWEFPKLQNLTLLRCNVELQYESFSEFFLKVGKQIQVLDLYPGMIYREYMDDPESPHWWYPELLGWVPNLEHLIVHHDRKWRAGNVDYTHPNVKWIDIWEEIPASSISTSTSTTETYVSSPLFDYTHMGYFITQPSSESGGSASNSPGVVKYPSVRGIRVFPRRLQRWGSNLPYTLPLSPTQGPEHVTYRPICDFELEEDLESADLDGTWYDDYNDCFSSDDEEGEDDDEGGEDEGEEGEDDDDEDTDE